MNEKGEDTNGTLSSLFASSLWLNSWLSAFGGQESGYWPLQANAQSPRIAYVIQTRQLGPISLRIAAAAANSHTPRFDITGTVAPTGGQLLGMMKELRVSALIFPYLSPSSCLIRSVETEKTPFRWERHFCEVAPFINCTGSWQEYLEARGRTRRSHWHKYERRMQRAGGQFESLKSWEEIAPCIPEILGVEASGWKGEAGSSIIQDLTTRSFYERMCQDLAKSGKLRLFLIRRDSQIIAFQLATLHAGILSGLKTSYLDGCAKESPGQVLQFWITHWAFSNEGVHTYDLLGPSSEYKLRFSTGVERLETLYVFASNTGGYIGWLRWSGLPRIRHLLRNLSGKSREAQEAC